MELCLYIIHRQHIELDFFFSPGIANSQNVVIRGHFMAFFSYRISLITFRRMEASHTHTLHRKLTSYLRCVHRMGAFPLF